LDANLAKLLLDDASQVGPCVETDKTPEQSVAFAPGYVRERPLGIVREYVSGNFQGGGRV
jgi:hypothetical protein